MEPTPFTAPLPCFGVEHDYAAKRCQECPHESDCIKHTGRRASRIPLSRLEFDLVPKAYALSKLIDYSGPRLQQTYENAHAAVFGENDHRPVGEYEIPIITNAKCAGLSVKHFIASAMVAYAEQQKARSGQGYGSPKPFHPARLEDPGMAQQARAYAKLVRQKYPTPSARLPPLSFEDLDLLSRDCLEKKLLESEVMAGRFVVFWKIFHQGPPHDALCKALETRLDPRWLAIEPTYCKTILADYLQNPRSRTPKAMKRFAASQFWKSMRKHDTEAINAYQTRERVMPLALSQVLDNFGVSPGDFEIEAEPVHDPMEVWIGIGRAIQHLECLQQIEEGNSVFAPPYRNRHLRNQS